MPMVAEATAPSVKCSQMGLITRTYTKKTSMVACASNSSREEVKAGSSLGLTDSLLFLLGKFQANERPCLLLF